MKGPKGFTRFLTLAGVYLKDPHTRLRLLSAVKEYAHNKGHLIKGFQGDLRTLISLIKDWNRGIYTDVSKKTILLGDCGPSLFHFAIGYHSRFSGRGGLHRRRHGYSFCSQQHEERVGAISGMAGA